MLLQYKQFPSALPNTTNEITIPVYKIWMPSHGDKSLLTTDPVATSLIDFSYDQMKPTLLLKV